MGDQDTEGAYLTWLYTQVGSPRMRAKHRLFWRLFEQMLHTDFVWFVHNDDNRAADGKDLRYTFLRETRREAESVWLHQTCSVFELVMAVSQRMAFDAGGIPHDWFWTIMGNLELSGCHDEWYESTKDSEVVVDEVLSRLIWRNYDPDGRGGMFPLEHPAKDQRTVEIWFQLQSYILEHV